MYKFKSTKYLFFFFFILFFISFPFNLYSQIIRQAGTTDRHSSQLVLWYDNDQITTDRATSIQITNASNTDSVWIHVQIFDSFDTDGDITTTGDKVICHEFDFPDFLTPGDTHVYNLNTFPIIKNQGETATAAGDTVFFDVRNTKGFVVITPVVSNSDLTAISFQNLFGTSTIIDSGPFDLKSYRLNAMGRDAVDLITGDIAPDGTVLDGVTNGFVLIQPDELTFSFQNLSGLPTIPDDKVDIIGINFSDIYGPPGLLGYSAAGGASTNWTSFLFDYRENVFSCGSRVNSCFFSIGLTFDIGDANLLLDDDVLCSSIVLPGVPGSSTINGWSKIFILGLDGLENQFGVFVTTSQPFVTGGAILSYGGADWMLSLSETSVVSPAEDCLTPGDEDGDGLADCADTDCDGLTGPSGETCEFGTENNCTDGFDNDADGDTDCDDPDCESDISCELASFCDPFDDGTKIKIIGTEGDDILTGTEGSDIIIGFGGNDIIDGLDGDDCIDGGLEDDIILGGKGNDSIFGNEGNDELSGNKGNDFLDGGADFDDLDGHNGTDTCINGEIIKRCE